MSDKGGKHKTLRLLLCVVREGAVGGASRHSACVCCVWLCGDAAVTAQLARRLDPHHFRHHHLDNVSWAAPSGSCQHEPIASARTRHVLVEQARWAFHPCLPSGQPSTD